MCLLLTEATKNLVKQKPLITSYFTQEPEVETYFQLVKLKKNLHPYWNRQLLRKQTLLIRDIALICMYTKFLKLVLEEMYCYQLQNNLYYYPDLTKVLKK